MTHDAIVIGGGFYGTAIACYLRELRGFNTVLLVERQAELFGRASYNNQARVHNGYHYPRSFTTAFRSRVNLPRFVRDFSGASRRFDRPVPIVHRHFRPAKPPTSAKSAPTAGDSDKNAPDSGACQAIISPFFRKNPQLRRPARTLRSPRAAASKKPAAA